VSSLLKARREDLVNGLTYLLDPTFDLEKSFYHYRQRAIQQGVNIENLWRLTKYYEEVGAAMDTAKSVEELS
jgi:hypothetical protein